jgi:recombination associated protein RdgC
MAKLKGIKAAMPFAIGAALHTWCGKAVKNPEKVSELIAGFKHIEPGADAWISYGLVEPFEEGSFVHSLDGLAHLMFMKFSEKILPGAVRDKELAKRLKELFDKTGRAPTKVEYAQTRDEAEAYLLPKAFVRDTIIPILVYKDKIIFCTTSAKKMEQANSVLTQLAQARKVEYDPHYMDGEHINFHMTELAKSGVIHFDDEDSAYRFDAGKSGVFRRDGEQKAVARIKDRDLSHAEVQKLFDSGYEATEIGMSMYDQTEGKDSAQFTLTEKWVIKGIKLADKDELRTHADAHATYWLYARYIGMIVDLLQEALAEAKPDGDDEL